jgi:hypothetical protein
MKCSRCKKDFSELNELTFTTKEKIATVNLCNICFNAARVLWKNFLYGEQRSNEQRSNEQRSNEQRSGEKKC